ncbi:MAG: cobalamin-dependent protein [Lachnotalea sp.]
MSTFAIRLKELRNKKNILQKELSKDLGVSQTTISNYEKGIRFPDEDTLKKFANYFSVSLDYLFGYVPEYEVYLKSTDEQTVNTSLYKDSMELTPLARQYMQYLLEGEKSKATILLLEAIRKGEAIKSIYLNILERTLKEVGRLWETNRIDITHEHYFSEATKEIMAYINIAKPVQEKNGHTLISFSIGGEHHNIGIRMVTDFMEMDGWDTYFLGTNVPSQCLIKAIEYYNADIILISATMYYNLDSVSNLIDTIRSSHLIKTPKILVGGLAFNYDRTLWKKIKADGYSYNATDCVELANELIQNSNK